MSRRMNSRALIRMTAVTKRFPGVIANDAVDFDLFPGEIHTLLGENGAGKSTLMHILAGMGPADSGSIEVKGTPVRIRSPFDSLRMGIGMVYQHFALVPNLTVIENVILGFEPGAVLNRRRAEIQLEQILEKFGLNLPLDAKVKDLSVGEQQRVEIAKVLFHRSEVLILDEPTSVLTPDEAEELFETLSSLRRFGKGVVFITHKLKEALRISDRISILKQGRKVAELLGADLRQMEEEAAYRRVFEVMFGAPGRWQRPRPKGAVAEKPVLELNQVVCLGNSGAERLDKISLKLNSGEIFGVAGVDGNGQKALAEIIAGQRKIESGSLILNGKDITHIEGPAARSDLGISYITDDRIQEGCALSMSVAENSILRLFRRPPFSRWKILDKAGITQYAEDLIREFNIKVSGPEVKVRALSGGNIQKLLLARELTRHPLVLICNKPTQGLDAQTAQYVYERLNQELARGATVLLISSDLDELLGHSHRIGVLFAGELLEILDGSRATQETVGKRMLGIRP